jgi:hypothetical protein
MRDHNQYRNEGQMKGKPTGHSPYIKHKQLVHIAEVHSL